MAVAQLRARSGAAMRCEGGSCHYLPTVRVWHDSVAGRRDGINCFKSAGLGVGHGDGIGVWTAQRQSTSCLGEATAEGDGDSHADFQICAQISTFLPPPSTHSDLDGVEARLGRASGGRQ
ncbi:hypothetical protein EUGRSUZ_D01475 [Eucalyptus grandis]|uniref:Uncharacterized protein n=2 Tax=Eucalyptus grandis TaxID=71139 RepID=A0ACC3L7L1_EUCGR|nr:hypothetical protein EUGRSUZ_D01475 [Eucalyptus grandis]